MKATTALLDWALCFGIGHRREPKPPRKRKSLLLTICGVLLVNAFISQSHASAADEAAERLELGRTLYGEHCASCHGAKLEGQPNWRKRKANGRMPAPPHDATGHTWHHSDDQLFKITKHGTKAIVGDFYKSDMPGFGDLLSDDEIHTVIAFIKSTWPERIRKRQHRKNGRAKQ